MTKRSAASPFRFVDNIRQSGLSIYDTIAIGDPQLWIPTPELEWLLNNGLKGFSFAGLPLRTRSKMVKEQVCNVLGYPVPLSFKKTRPRFPGQMFDTYTQKANNLQVWNEELSAARRYVLVRVVEPDVVITRVKVVTGESLALLDTTGTLTKKYQARCIPSQHAIELITSADTANLLPFVSPAPAIATRDAQSPAAYPESGALLSIASLFDHLSLLIGQGFADTGSDQERNRGAALHRLVCRALGYARYQDGGQFPDVPHQLLEVKLQTAPTIDLGLVSPDSAEPLDMPMITGRQIRHCDVRYAIFYAQIAERHVQLTHLILSTGTAFFTRFPKFQGKTLNAKLQIRLSASFFDL